MRTDKALSEILLEIDRIASVLPGATWYGFGSYFNEQGPFGDIDILVTCPTTADAILIREQAEDLCDQWPLHLVIMTEDEQRETGFVSSQGCVRLHAAEEAVGSEERLRSG
jgi:hypothetical protein